MCSVSFIIRGNHSRRMSNVLHLYWQPISTIHKLFFHAEVFVIPFPFRTVSYCPGPLVDQEILKGPCNCLDFGEPMCGESPLQMWLQTRQFLMMLSARAAPHVKDL